MAIQNILKRYRVQNVEPIIMVDQPNPEGWVCFVLEVPLIMC